MQMHIADSNRLTLMREIWFSIFVNVVVFWIYASMHKWGAFPYMGGEMKDKKTTNIIKFSVDGTDAKY